MFWSGVLLAAQANAGEIKTLVIFFSNEMPDENTDQNTTQPPSRQPTCFNVISSLTPEQGMHDERKKECLHPWVRVDQADRPLPPKTLSILVGLTLKLV